MYKLIKDNLLILVIFEALYSAFISFLFTPFLRLIINATIRIAGYPYLDQSNLLPFFSNPLVIIFWLFILFAISYVTLLDFNAINLIYIAGVQETEINLFALFTHALRITDKTPRRRNITLYIYICLLLPFSGVVYQNPVIEQLKIPSFLLAYIKANPLTLFGLVVGIIAAVRYSILNLYTFLYLIDGNGTPLFRDAKNQSMALVKKTYKEIIPELSQCVLITAFLLFGLFGFQTAFYHISLHLGDGLPFRLFCSALLTINVGVTTVVNVVVKVYIMYVIAGIFFRNEQLPLISFEKEKHPLTLKAKRIRNVIIVVAVFIFILVTSFASVTLRTKIMAHRGSSIEELENTEPAFIKAMEDGVTYIELDVVETKDHQLVICHDHNLKRLAGLDKNIEEMNLSEVLSVPIADKEKSGKLMTLAQLLPLVGPTVTLNIEIKTDGTNQEAMAEEVVALLRRYPRHMVSCLDAQVLEDVKALSPLRKCGLIMVVAVGNFENLPYADFFSIEKSFAGKRIINEIHELNKQVFVWDVNNKETAASYFDLNVDGVITDYPKMLEEELYKRSIAQKTSTLKYLFVSDFSLSSLKW